MAGATDSTDYSKLSEVCLSPCPFGPVGTEDYREVQVRALRAGGIFNCPVTKCDDMTLCVLGGMPQTKCVLGGMPQVN